MGLRNRKALALLVWGATTGSTVAACAVEDGAVQLDARDVNGLETIVAPQGQYVHFPLCEAGQTCGRINGSVDLRVVACSANITCEPSLLHDPRTLERGPTLVAGFSCGFPDNTPPQDVLLGYHPTIRCYYDGVISNRATWLPPDGVAPDLLPSDHITYAQQSSPVGDVYSNAALVMTPLKAKQTGNGSTPFAFCEVSAWGAVAFSGKSEGQLVDSECTAQECARKRRGAHIQWAPAIHWRALVSWSDVSGWNCHAAGTTPQTWVERVVLTAAAHDLPFPLAKGQLPATQDYALLSVELRDHPEVDDPQTPAPEQHHTLILRYTEDSEFPMEPQGAPPAMVERNLWVRLPQQGPPADVEVTWSCSEVDGNGAITRIGALLRDRDLQAPIGALVIEKDGVNGPWNCLRNAAGECRLIEQAEWSLLTPCLLPAQPVSPPSP
jgi:hypothetical protein